MGDRRSDPNASTPMPGQMTPAATWIMGIAFPALFAAVGVAAIATRHVALGSHWGFGTTRPAAATGQQAVGWGVMMLGIAVILNAIFFVDTIRPDAMRSPFRMVVGVTTVIVGLVCVVFAGD